MSLIRLITLFVGSVILLHDFVYAKSFVRNGLMILYKPSDITYSCSMSKNLRYDISFGMGMSDTITLVLRTDLENDFKCIIEVVGDNDAHIILVIHYQNTVRKNCYYNPNAFVIVKDHSCVYICDIIHVQPYSRYFTVALRDRVKLLFTSNSSLNADMHVSYYQVTVTSARKLVSNETCLDKYKGNETTCRVEEEDFCFTNGVVCDGIKNCGVSDWYDERGNNCELPPQALGLAPVITVVAAVCCALLAGGHILMKYLPPVANSFFIFNVNEDNRLYLDPVLVLPSTSFIRDRNIWRKQSIIPVSSSSTTSIEQTSIRQVEQEMQTVNLTNTDLISRLSEEAEVVMREEDLSQDSLTMMQRLQNKFVSASKFFHKPSKVSKDVENI